MPFYSFAFLLALACAGFFYTAGERESNAGFLWGALSLAISLAMIFLFAAGIWLVLASQVGLLLAITVFRVLRDGDKPRH